MQTYQLNVTGYLCPLPLIMLKKALQHNPNWQRFILLVNKESLSDIQIFCQENHIVIEQIDERQSVEIILRSSN